MPTAYNSHTSTLDRPLQPGDFVRYAEAQTSQEAYPSAVIDAQEYSAQPPAHVETAHQEAASLAQPASIYRSDMYIRPHAEVAQSQEVMDYQVEAEREALIGGVENMLTEAAPNAAAYLDSMNSPEPKNDAMAPSLEYANGAQLIEAYNAACAIMDVRRATATAAGIEHNYN